MKRSLRKASIKILKADEPENSFAGFDINDELLPLIEKKKKHILDICNQESGESVEVYAQSNSSFNDSKNFDIESQSKLQKCHSTVSMESVNCMIRSLSYAFKYLTTYELLCASQASYSWNIIAMNDKLWQTVCLKNCKVINWYQCIEFINNHGSVALDTRQMLIPTDIEELQKFWSTFSLAINKAEKLKYVELYRCPAIVVEQTLTSLTQLTVLNATSIKNSSDNNDDKMKMLITLDLKYLNHMVLLSELKLKGLSGIKLTFLPSLKKLVNLKCLALTSIEEFPKNFCHSLETISTNLEVLEIGNCNCLPKDFAGILKKFSNLSSLRLENCHGLWKNNAQAVFCSIRGLDTLKILEFINIEIDNSVKKELEKCDNIKALLIIPAYFVDCAITNSNLFDCLKKFSNTLSHLVWGVDQKLLITTENLIAAYKLNRLKMICGLELLNPEETTKNVPLLRKIKPGKEFETEEDEKKDLTLYMLPILAFEKLLKSIFKAKIKVIEVPYLKTDLVYLTQYFNDI